MQAEGWMCSADAARSQEDDAKLLIEWLVSATGVWGEPPFCALLFCVLPCPFQLRAGLCQGRPKGGLDLPLNMRVSRWVVAEDRPALG